MVRRLRRYRVRHDRSEREFEVRGKSTRSVEKRYPSKDFTVLGTVKRVGRT